MIEHGFMTGSIFKIDPRQGDGIYDTVHSAGR
jgi:hypothetical protein